MKSRLLSIVLILVCPLLINAQVFQFRGPNRDGKFECTNLLKEWPKNGPELFMEVDSLGKGFSSVIATDKYIYVTGMIDTLDYLTCIDYDGNKKWQIPYGEAWKKSFPDTRSSVTVEDDRIYVISGIGELVCMNAETGNISWKKNVDKDYASDWHIWGVSESPLIIDNMVICSPGGKETSIVAFDKLTGEEIWKTESVGGQRAYSSPTIYEYNGSRYILANTANYLMAIRPENGEVVWRYNYYELADWKWQSGLIWTNIPTWKDNQIFLSMGYDYPAVMLEVDSLGTSVSEKFVDQTIDNHHHGLIEHDGYLYSSIWKSNRTGKWACMNWLTGEIEYVNEWVNKGSMVYADGMLYCYEEKSGNVGLVKPDPKGFEVVSSFKVEKGSGPHWSHPYIYNGKLFLRHGNVMQVYNIASSGKLVL